MTRAAYAAVVLSLLAAPPARAQEGRDHTHRPTQDMTDARALLRMVVALQESYNAERGRYATRREELKIPVLRLVRLDLAADGARWYSAVARSSSEECVLYHGPAQPPRAYATQADRIMCRPVAANALRGR